MFHDRTQAGAALAAAMPELRKKANVTVIGLARGGVEVAAELAKLLDLPLDVLCVRKVSTPGHPELAMGAVAPQGERYTNRRVAGRLTPTQVDAAYDKATMQAREMDERLRAAMPMMLVGRTAVIVDDGAATGASIRAALAAVRNAGARQTVIALPVLPRLAVERLERECDRLVTLKAPQRFHAVSQFYEQFGEVTESRVMALLANAKPAVELTV
ncbi:MAG TPA: phosphoribosyltransferase family protein [Gaiellales bacterium]|nr:phosphoribosyltransferase family protein [Gaiellales bacterium]